MANRGYHGMSQDHYLAHNEQSTIHKMKKTYWTTKQAVIQKLGKKEDQHVIASDQELDAKLEVFKAVQMSSMELLRVIEKYQDRLFALSQEENAMGRLLKRNSQMDKTRAGKMMAAVGKSQSFSSQQRLALRVPLARLYQEVETFRYRAVSDMMITVNRMEESRTNYRGALLWMKDVSSELDPDTYKQLDKFRKVQAQVKNTKARFDKLKLDTMQKIDLLAASRCNMYSHALANYQSTLLHFWQKTSRTMTVVSDSFKGYQYFEFNMLKELCEPSKQLAEAAQRKEIEGGDDDEPQEGNKNGSKKPTTKPLEQQSNEDVLSQLLSTDSQKSSDDLLADSPLIPFNSTINNSDVSHKESDFLSPQQTTPAQNDRLGMEGSDDIPDLMLPPITGSEDDDVSGLISLTDNNTSGSLQRNDSGSMTNLLQDIDREIQAPVDKSKGGEGSFIPWQEDESLESIKRKQEEEFGFHPKMFGQRTASESEKKSANNDQEAPRDILSGDFDSPPKDDLSMLNEILGGDNGADEFSPEWQAMFGQSLGSRPTPSSLHPAQDVPSSNNQGGNNQQQFLPSQLLDMNQQMAAMSMTPNAPMAGNKPSSTAPAPAQLPGKSKKQGDKPDMSAWYGLFADLDPLSNPDAVGKSKEQLSDAL